MEDIFGGETIPVPGSSPEGHDETAAVETNEEEQFDEQFDQDEPEGEEADEQDSDSDDEGTEHSEELLAGKYKSTDDLVRAYKELERKFHGQRQGGAQQQQQPTAQPPAPQGGQQDPNQAFWTAFRDNPMGTIQALVQHAATQQVAPLIEERQTETLGRHFDGLAKEYRQLTTEEGMQQFATAIRDVAAELGNPDLARNPTPRVLRMAAQEAFGDSKAAAYQKGKQAGRQESEQTRQAKQGLGAKSGARPAKGGAEPTLEQSIKDSILAAGKGGGGIFG